MVARGALSILFNMCSSSSINIAMNAVKALFLFAKARMFYNSLKEMIFIFIFIFFFLISGLV